MKLISNRFVIRRPLAVAIFAGFVLTGCASQVPLESSAPAPTTSAASGAKAQSEQEAAKAREIAAARAALKSIEPSVFFDLDRFEIKAQYQPTIAGFANYLKVDPKARIVVEGHADERGTTEYNLALGQKRAEAVSKALGVLGVAANRVESISFGEEKPRARGSNEQAWSQNRRADLVIR